ncbi:hypothetical protein GCM10010384_06040 [Streptomyces djakartensis]|uniref:Anaphase-promoting complex subunit 4 WD40 domain-containing protein n=1 Tax=Streptomyces djakartensis TaxID=68193 RepID=A0ABQ2Z8G7_9ACTN|nr:hypothetical protein GCM10010384_06040 [Streptomyces djakartensis]
MLAVAGSHGTIQIWDITSPLPRRSAVSGTGDAVLALAFSRDGTTLKTLGTHTPLRTHTVSPGPGAARVCQRVGRSLSREDWQAYLPKLPYRRIC